MKISLLLMAFVVSGCSMIGPNERGVITHFGDVAGEVGPGAYFWIPFARGIAKFDLRVQKDTIETTAASKDLQDVHSNVAVNWRIDPAQVTRFYKEIGYEDAAVERIIIPAVSEVLKASTAKKTAEEIIGKRGELKADIDSGMKDRLTRYGLFLDDVSIVNVAFSKDFALAIEAKQIAEQSAKQAEYTAQKAIKDADAAVNRAKGERDSQAMVRTSLTPELLQKLAIEKWDGHFPQVTGGGPLPFINLSLK